MKFKKPKISKETFVRALVSLLLAILLWAIALTDDDPNITASVNGVPISYINLSEEFTIDHSAQSVNIKIYGRTLQMAKMKKSDITASVDMSGVNREGVYTLPVRINGLSENYDVSEISTPYVSVTVSRYVAQEHNYEIEYSGSLAEGCYVMTTETDVKNVSVEGSQAEIDKVQVIKASIALKGQSDDFAVETQLNAYDSEGKIIEGLILVPEKLKANIAVGLEKSVNVKVITEGNVSQNAVLESIASEPKSVTISGRASQIREIDSISTQMLDLSQVSQTHTFSLGLSVPKQVSTISQKTVKVTVKVTSLVTSTFDIGTVQIRNCPAALSCELSGFDGAQVIIGSTNDIKPDKEDIILYVDLSGYESGTHTVQIQYTLSEGLKLISMSPQSVSVNLKSQ